MPYVHKTLTYETENLGYLFHLLPDIDIWLDTERWEATEATEGEVARSVRYPAERGEAATLSPSPPDAANMSATRIEAAPRDDATMTVWRISVNLSASLAEYSRGVMLKRCRMCSSLSSRGVPLAPTRLLAPITPSVSGFSPVKRKPSFPEQGQVN